MQTGEIRDASHCDMGCCIVQPDSDRFCRQVTVGPTGVGLINSSCACMLRRHVSFRFHQPTHYDLIARGLSELKLCSASPWWQGKTLQGTTTKQ